MHMYTQLHIYENILRNEFITENVGLCILISSFTKIRKWEDNRVQQSETNLSDVSLGCSKHALCKNGWNVTITILKNLHSYNDQQLNLAKTCHCWSVILFKVTHSLCYLDSPS